MKIARRTVLKSLGLGACAAISSPLMAGRLSAAGAASPDRAAASLPRSSPEAEGVASSGILEFLASVRTAGYELHSFMMLRHGHVIAEGWWAPYQPTAVHPLFSLSKSFTATAVGFAVSEGRLRLDDRLISFFPHQLPARVGTHLSQLTIEHLLTMTVGHTTDSTAALTREEDWVKAFLALPIEHPPGSRFFYDNGSTYLLSAVIRTIAGQPMVEYLRPRLFTPLGISDVSWVTCPRGINAGGWGLSLTTDAVARFGQLYLQQGRWQGSQILPAGWVTEATAARVQQPDTFYAETLAKDGLDVTRLKEQSDLHQGYGYLFWRGRHGTFMADGALAQCCIVAPEQDAVIVTTACVPNPWRLRELVWKHLLPAIKKSPLRSRRVASGHLRQTLAALALSLPQGRPSAATAHRISGKRFIMEENSLGVGSVFFTFDKSECELTLTRAGGNARIYCGIGAWMDGIATLPGTPPEATAILGPPINGRTPVRVAAAGAWQDERTFTMHWRYYETAYEEVVTCRFGDGDVTIEFVNSLDRLGPGLQLDTRPMLKGSLTEITR